MIVKAIIIVGIEKQCKNPIIFLGITNHYLGYEKRIRIVLKLGGFISQDKSYYIEETNKY